MENLNIQMETPIAMGLAIARGWTPTVDDTTKELIGDEYPQVPNPITYQKFLEGFIPQYIQEFVLMEGREKVIAEFESMKANIFDSVKKGSFDSFILQ